LPISHETVECVLAPAPTYKEYYIFLSLYFQGLQGFCKGNLNVSNHLDDLVVDGEIILKLMLKNVMGGVDCIYMAQAMDK
jgi:hypothetical protein